MSFSFEQIPQEQLRIPGENYFNTATPYFKYKTGLNEVQSEMQGKPVFETIEGVELRFAANPQYRPFFPVDKMYRKVGNRVITWAERFKDQYQQFINGSTQVAEGTPLEELLPYGMTPAQLSICRAQSIYSIEALDALSPAQAKRLGYNGNDLRSMAKRYMESRENGSSAAAEIAELRAQIAKLTGEDKPVVSSEMLEDEPELPEGFEDMSDDKLKEEIARLAGSKPRGNPSRTTLIANLTELRELQDTQEG